MTSGAAGVSDVSLAEVKAGLADGTLVLVDVREPHEFASASIAGSVSMPLSGFDPADLPVQGGGRVVFSCAAGVRSVKAIELCQAAGLDLREHFSGGLRGWLQAGEPVQAGGAGTR
jgi:rhodanese-related sulfurtransferase